MKRLSTTILAAAFSGLLFSGTAAAGPPPADDGQGPGAPGTVPSPQEGLDILGSLPIASTLSSYLIPGLSSLPLTEFGTPLVDSALNSQATNANKRTKSNKIDKKPTSSNASERNNNGKKGKAADPPATGPDPISDLLGLGLGEGEGLLAGVPIIGDWEPALDLLGDPAITGGLGAPAAKPKVK